MDKKNLINLEKFIKENWKTNFDKVLDFMRADVEILRHYTNPPVIYNDYKAGSCIERIEFFRRILNKYPLEEKYQQLMKAFEDEYQQLLKEIRRQEKIWSEL